MAKDLREEKGEALRGGKGLRGERISAEGGKGEDLGTKALGGKGGQGSEQGKGGKDLREEREKIWGP